MCPSPTTAYRTALFPLDFIGFFSTYGTLNFPDCNRYTHPRGGRRDQNQSRTESRQQTPHQNCEDDEGHASHSGPSGVYARSLRARAVAAKPASFCFSFSCFSMRVALEGKIAGNARKSPAIAGPYSFAMIAARAVIAPPKRKRVAYSCHSLCRMASKSTLTFKTMLLSQPHIPDACSHAQPYNNG